MRWLGTNCLLLLCGETRLLIDPHFSRPSLTSLLRKIKPDPERIRHGVERLGLDRLDAVLITHTHYDHFLDAFETARLLQADLYGSESVLRAAGRDQVARVHDVQPGQAYRIGSLTVNFLPTRHLVFPARAADLLHMNAEIEQSLEPPVWFWQYRAGTVYNLLIEIAGHRVYLQGSAGLTDDHVDDRVEDSADDSAEDGADDNVEDSAEDSVAVPEVKAAVLGIGALGLKSRAYLRHWYEQSVERTGAEQIYLSHWDDFFRPWNEHPHDLPGTRRVIRNIRRLAAGRGNITINRLPPG